MCAQSISEGLLSLLRRKQSKSFQTTRLTQLHPRGFGGALEDCANKQAVTAWRRNSSGARRSSGGVHDWQRLPERGV